MKKDSAKKASVPAGYVSVKLLLPEHQAAIVKIWAAEADAALRKQKK